MKSIPNCEGYYVNEAGEVFSCVKKISGVNGKRGTYTIIDENAPVKLTPQPHPTNGYVYVNIGKYGRKRLHRLVAEAYIPNPNNLPEVNHLNHNKEDNSVTNLEWCSRQQNAEYSLAKHYIAEHIASGKQYQIFNLSAFCRENGLHVGSMHHTLKQRQNRRQHKGWRLISV